MIAAGCAETARDRAARGGRSAATRARLRLSMGQVRKTRKGKWWQFCGRSARLRTHQSGVCSCFSVNHDGNNWGKQLQQAAQCAVAHNPGPGTKVRVHCIDHAQIPFACTLSLMQQKKKSRSKSAAQLHSVQKEPSPAQQSALGSAERAHSQLRQSLP